MNKDWISINDLNNKIPNEGDIEIKFQSGHTCNYNDTWPFDLVTHWRYKLKNK